MLSFSITDISLNILLRWKNGNGIAFPAFQIKYVKIKMNDDGEIKINDDDKIKTNDDVEIKTNDDVEIKINDDEIKINDDEIKTNDDEIKTHKKEQNEIDIYYLIL
jgi:hypothetical protein